MIHLRPQRVYKPSALSYLGNPSDIADSLIDRYSNKDLYRLRIETPRGTSITADNSQITCYAHIFDKEDGTELTDLLKGRGYRPTWLLDGKPIDSTRISEEGYQITLETDHLPNIYQTVTLQVRDTDILLALTTDENQKRVYSQLIELGSIPTHLIKTSEKLLNVSRLDKIRVEGLEEVRRDLSEGISANSVALEELHKNPLTVDKDGYWRIWDIKQHQYVTTEYQSRGDKGEPGATGAKGDKGDKPVITLNDKYQLLADGVLLSQQSLKGAKGDRGATGATGAKGADGKDGHTPNINWDGTKLIIDDLQAVDLRGQRGETGARGATGAKGDKGDKPVITLNDKYQLLADGVLLSQQSLKGAKGDRGETGATGAKGEKGDKPKLTLDSQLRLLADGELLSQQSLKGAKGDKGEQGAKGDKGDKPKLTLDSQLRLLADGELLSQQSLKGERGETGARGATGATGAKGEPGHSPEPEDVLGTSRFAELLDNSVRTNVNPRLNQSDQEIDNAFKYIQAIYNKLDSRYIIDITTSGYVTARSEKSCSYVAKNETPEYLPTCQIPNNRPRIRLTIRSDHDALKRQVDTLTAQLAQLQASTTITPILDTSLRREYDPVSRKRGITLHPDYGDWILSSDVDQLHLSFEGLRAEVGRSIYIQTRKRVYLLANGHSFYGLPGTSSSVAVNQWLSNNTTYRFVRASSTSWLVTASSSPYPWT